MEDKDLQNKYMEYKFLQEQVEQLQKVLEYNQQQEMQMSASRVALEEIKTVNNGSDILVPLSNGVFLNAVVTNTSLLTLNVGANTMVTKSPDEAMQIIEKQVESLRGVSQQLHGQLHQISERLAALGTELTSAVKHV